MSDSTKTTNASDKGVVRIRDVAHVDEDARIKLTANQRLARRGKYPHYVENCGVSGLDDYTLESGGCVMVSAMGQVISSAGTLQAALELGRCSASEYVHALVPDDPADAPYLWRALTTSPSAGRFVVGTPQLRELSKSSLLAISIPWPDAQTRADYVRALDELDERHELVRKRIAAIYAQGDKAYNEVASTDEQTVALSSVCRIARGTDVPIAQRGANKPVPIVGPSVVLGHCDTVLVDKRCLTIGPSARRLLAHIVREPSHPIAEMAYITDDASDIDLAALLFAVRHEGVLDRLPSGKALKQVPRYKMEELENLPLHLGTQEAMQQFIPVAKMYMDEIADIEDEITNLDITRRDLISSFFDEERAALRQSNRPDTSDTSKTSNAYRMGLLDRVRLGRLTDVIDDGFTWGLGASDLAWELGPLVVLRCCLSEDDWSLLVQAAVGGDDAAVVPAIDQGLATLASADDLLAFLPNLSYASSLLKPYELAAWIDQLDTISPDAICGDNLRALFNLQSDPIPLALTSILENIVEAVAPNAETAYIPYEDAGAAIDILGHSVPSVTMRVQFDDFEHVLSSAMVRAVQTRAALPERGGMGAAAGSALDADQFSDWKADLVVSVLPCNQGQWTQAQLNKEDPRWILGLPPRTRANYAWLQTALAHQAQGGITVLAVADAVLQSTTGSEPILRKKLIESQRVHCVVSLPARIFGDGRDPMSIIVLGDEGSSDCVLFVDANGLGARVLSEQPYDAQADVQAAERMLMKTDVRRVIQVCESWLEDEDNPEGDSEDNPERPFEAGFARTVGTQDILDAGGVLTPWTFV